MYLDVSYEDLINLNDPRITQLSLVKPEYNLSKTFGIAMSFDNQEFEQCPDRVRHPNEKWFIS